MEADNGGDDWGIYEIPTETNLKQYYIEEENYDGVFGTGKVIAPINGTTGNNRFYVMALEDVNKGTSYCWYDAAYGKLDKPVGTSENDFGQGRANTEYVMGKWNDESLPWGNHNDNETYLDMWGVIEDEINAGWFVPSKSEWAAFGAALSIDKNNYAVNYKLSAWYWSSSQVDTNYAYAARFHSGFIGNGYVYDGSYVRLSTTF